MVRLTEKLSFLIKILLTCTVCLINTTYSYDSVSIQTAICVTKNETEIVCPGANITELTLDSDELYSVDLSNNLIQIVPVLKASNLVTLNLQKNRIDTIDDRAFGSLTNLDTLDLSHNLIKGLLLTAELLDGCQQLKFLNLSHNPIEIVNENAFYGLQQSSLRMIDLSYSKIKEIDSFAFVGVGLLKLTHVYLRGNYLKEATAIEAFKYIITVKYLDLGENFFTSLNKNIFRNADNLEVLHMDKNLLTVLNNDSFSGLTYLKRLDLSNNKITIFPSNALAMFDNLEVLEMSKNPIGIVSTAGYNLKIKVLVLNDLTYLRAILRYAFTGIPTLKRLSISDCASLDVIQSEALDGVTLDRLVLHSNNLRYLPMRLVNWNELEYLDLLNNPWKCDCYSTWMVNVTQHWNMNLTCDLPTEMRGNLIANMKVDSLSCFPHVSTIILIVLPIIAVVIMCGVIAVVLYRVARKKGWRYICRCCRRSRSRSSSQYVSVKVFNKEISDSTVEIIKNEVYNENEDADENEHLENGSSVTAPLNDEIISDDEI